MCNDADHPDRSEIEAALSPGEAQYRQFFAALPDALLMYDVESGRLVEVNESACQLYGYTRQELLGLSLADILAQPIETAAIQEAVAGRLRRIPLASHRKKDGSVFPVEVSISAAALGERKLLCGIVRDVSERLRAEEMLRDSERRYRQMFYEHAAIRLLIDPATGQIEQANLAAAQFYGYPVETLESMNIVQINTLPYSEILEQMQKVQERKCNYFVFQHRLASGAIRDVEIYCTLIQIAGRNVLYSVVHDITERKRIEAALQQGLSIVENIPIGLHIYHLEDLSDDRTLRMVYANPITEKFTGLPVVEIMGKTLDENFPGLRQLGVPQQYAEVARTQVSRKLGVVRYGDKRMAANVFAVEAFPMPDQHVGVVFENITERQKIEEALREHEEELRVIFEHAQDGIHVTNEADEILQVNPRFCEMIGYSRAELLHMRVGQLQAPEMRGRSGSIVRDELAKHGNTTFEGLDVHRDGRCIPVEISVARIQRPQGDWYISIVRDITERKRASEALQQAFEEKQRLLRELQHRAKNSFALVSSVISLMQDANPSLEAKSALAEIGSRVKALTELYDLLYVSDAVTAVELDEYCERIAASLRLPRNIHLEQVYEKVSAPAKIAAPLGLVLTELLTNALKYAFPGGRAGTIRISLQKMSAALPAKAAAGARIKVEDDGVGLAEGFDLTQSNSLGLVMVQALAQQIEGDFHIERAQGVRCSVDFPLENPGGDG